MNILCLDTAYRYLTLAVIKDDKLLRSYSHECFKSQSEAIFPHLQILMDECHLNLNDLSAICITKGPGSYTGVRIAMTIAKVLCSIADLKLYTISTTRLYAGNKEDTLVLLDARAQRAYVGIYDQEKVIMEDSILKIEDIPLNHKHIIGDAHLIDKEAQAIDIGECFLKTMPYWEIVEKIDELTPLYLKESEAYHR